MAVLGAGRMGAAIAAEYAASGRDVRITTSSQRSKVDALGRVATATRQIGGEVGNAGTVAWCGSTSEAAAGVGLVVECLPEDLDVKRRELRLAQKSASSGAVLATNTSSLRVTSVGELLDDPSRLVGTHYLNPPYAFETVEVIAGERTSGETVETITRVLTSLGKRPVRVNRDVPGFVINRLQFAFLREALALVDAGVIEPAALDQLMTEGLGRRLMAIGPFATVAVGGESVFQGIAERLFPELSCVTVPPARIGRITLTPDEESKLCDARDARLAALAERSAASVARPFGFGEVGLVRGAVPLADDR